MGEDAGEGSFGFAPRGDPVRKKIGRRAAAPAPRPAMPSHPSLPAGGWTSRSQKPPWVWLLIGIMLGTGGTLLTSAFWLPDSREHRTAGLDMIDDREVANGDVATAEGSTGSGDDPSGADTLAEALTGGKAHSGGAESEPGADDDGKVIAGSSATTSTPAASMAEVERGTSPSPEYTVAEAERQAIDGEAGLKSPVNDEPMPVVGLDETPAPAPMVPDEVETASKPPSLSPETALAALTAERGDQFPTAGPASGPGPGRLDEENRQTPAQAENDADAPAAPPTGVAAEPGADTLEARPPGDADQAELPPRIRQALRAAAEESSGNARASAGGSRLYRIQLAAVDDEAAARVYWREVNQRLPGVFTDVEPIFDQRRVDERLFLRIWVGAFDRLVDADGYCGWLKEQGQDCFVTRVDNL